MFAEDILQHGIECSQDLVVTDHQVGLCAQRVENTGQLDRDVTGTDNSNPLGLLLDVKEAVRVDTVGCPGNLLVRGDSGSPSNSDNKLFGSDGVFGTVGPFDLNLVLVEERSVSFMVIDLVVHQVLLTR